MCHWNIFLVVRSFSISAKVLTIHTQKSPWTMLVWRCQWQPSPISHFPICRVTILNTFHNLPPVSISFRRLSMLFNFVSIFPSLSSSFIFSCEFEQSFSKRSKDFNIPENKRSKFSFSRGWIESQMCLMSLLRSSKMTKGGAKNGFVVNSSKSRYSSYLQTILLFSWTWEKMVVNTAIRGLSSITFAISM